MTGGSNAASDRLREELEGNKSRLALLEDLTGLQVTSAIEQPEGIVFTCILTDLLCKIGSTFILLSLIVSAGNLLTK